MIFVLSVSGVQWHLFTRG